MLPASTVTSVKWGRTAHGGVTRRCTWFYGIDISMYAQEYANTAGFLVFKGDGPKDDSYYPARTMWTLS